MGALAIEIQDAGIAAVREGGLQPVVDSPGVALFDGSEILTGRTAARKARLLPRHRSTRFWDPLDRSPLPKPFPPKLTAADLAHAHLSALWKGLADGVDRVLLLVPGWYSDEELGLLLGIARACGMPVTSMVDLALAAALEAEGGSAIHLDLHLHRVAGARIVKRERLVRESVQCDDGAGLVALENTWASVVARKFVHETRFDPMHVAATEQDLYDRIPRLLAALLERESETLVLKASGKEHAVQISRSELVDAALPYYRRLFHLARSLDPTQSWPRILLSSRLAALPGLSELVAREVSPVVTGLAPGAAAVNVLAHRHLLPQTAGSDDSIPFATSLALDVAPPFVAPPSHAPQAVEGVPTHVLHGGAAYPLEPTPFLLGISIPEGSRGLSLESSTPGISRHHCTFTRGDGAVIVEDRSRYGSFLNGDRVEGKATVRAGDRLRLGTSDVEVLLIEVKG